MKHRYKIFSRGSQNPVSIESIDNSGFSVRTGASVFRCQWSEITRITAYKVDLITTDCITVLLDLSEDRGSVVINEDMAGFDELDGAFASHLSGYDICWREYVVQPAFEENRRIIYSLAK